MITLASSGIYEEEIKKSRFLVHAKRADDVEEAMAFLKNTKDLKASHNCWAYKIDSQYRFSDDGEPGGTAGKPILSAIEHQQLDHIVVVVTRYFGGIKLGTGGLARAYGGTAAACLRLAKKEEILRKIQVSIQTSFTNIGQVYTLLDHFSVEKTNEEFTEDGVFIDISIDHVKLQEFASLVKETCRNEVKLSFEDE